MRYILFMSFCLFFLLGNNIEAKDFSVGYHLNLRSWFTSTQWTALDNGRKLAQREWAKVADITWSGAVYPDILIIPTLRTDVWAYVNRIGGDKLYISVASKFQYKWESEDHWRGLFMHEYGHCLGLADTYKDGHVMTIYGVRADTPSDWEIAWMQDRYGPPDSPQPTPTTLELSGTAGNDSFYFDAVGPIVEVNSEQKTVDSSIIEIKFDGLGGVDTAFLRGGPEDDLFVCSPNGAHFESMGFTVTTIAEVNHAYGLDGEDAAFLEDSSGNDELKCDPENEFVKMYGNGYYSRAKFFESVTGLFTNGGLDNITMFNRDVFVEKGISVEFLPYQETAVIGVVVAP